MKENVLKLLLVVTFLLIAPYLQAVVINSNQTIDSGSYDVVNITNEAILNVTGGYIDTCNIDDNCELNISGGGISLIYANNNDVNVYYLTLTTDYFQLNNPEEGTGDYWVSGTWSDGSSFNLYFARQYSELANIDLIQIPEPATILLFGVSGFRLRRMQENFKQKRLPNKFV